MHTNRPAGSISDGSITNLFSILSILIEFHVFVRREVGGGGGGAGGSLNDFKLIFGTFIGRFPSDGAANMAFLGRRED